jgi:hypothetical protein
LGGLTPVSVSPKIDPKRAMSDFTAFIPVTHQNISFGLMDVLIQERRQELFSGLMRISYPSGEKFVFMFLDGVQQRLYRCSELTTEIVNRHSWSQVLNRPGASVGFLPMDVDGLRVVRVFHETPVQSEEHVSLSARELVERIEAWAKNPQPGFVLIGSAASDHIRILVGSPNPIIEELTVTAGQAKFSIADESFQQTLPDATFTTSHYLSNSEHHTWREYTLRLAFHPLMRILLTRFGELAGRVLAERLGAQLTDWVTSSGWKMSINSNGVINREFFDTLDEANEVYAGILTRFREEAGLAVGPRLVENMFRETQMKLPPVFRDPLDQYINGLFGPGNAAFTTTTQKENTRL